MNQRRLTLEELGTAYRLAQLQAKALAICEALDRAENATQRLRQDALILTNYYLRRIAAK